MVLIYLLRTQCCKGMATYVPKGFVLCPVSQPCPLVGLETTRGEERRPPVALSSSPRHLSWAAVECAALRLWDVNAGLTRRHRHHQWPTNLQPHHTDHSGSRVTLDQTNSSPPKKKKNLVTPTTRQAISEAGGLHGAARLTKM